MSDKYKKIDKFFKLSDSTLNSHGFRLLTTGYQLANFVANPIGYYMHQRDNGTLLKWEDLQIDGDCVKGKPVINLSHPRGQQTVDEIENGFLNAASMGQFVVLSVSDNKSDYLPDQTGPTVTKWYNRECSLVDIPGNENALAQLYDKNNNPLLLADLKSSSSHIIQSLAVNKPVLSLATNQPVTKNFLSLSDILGKALTDHVIDEKQLQVLKAQYADNTAALPAFIDLLAKNKCENGLRNKDWDELDKSDELEFLKLHDPVGFEMKHLEKFSKTSTYTNLSAKDEAIVKQNAVTAKAEMIKRLTAMEWKEIEDADHLEYFKENAPVAFAAKAEYRFGKENGIVNDMKLNRQDVKAALTVERQMHIERLKNKTYLQLDKQGDMPFLQVAAPDLYREKYKEFHGKYPTE